MTTADKVRAARNPQEAMLAVAEALDALTTRFDELTAPQSAADAWGEWGADIDAELAAGPVIPAQVTEDDVRAWIGKNYHTDPADVTPEIIAQIRADIKQGGLGQQAELGDIYATEQGDGNVEIDFKPVDEKAAEERRKFADWILKLDDAYGPQPDSEPSWTDTYVKGGPMWLYLADRDLVLSYPDHVKSQMVADVLKYSPRAAQEMSIDILKQPMQKDTDSPAMKIGEGFIG